MVFGIAIGLALRIIAALAAVFVFAFLLTWAMHRFAMMRRWFDVPNHRSGHAVPTPNVGGIAFSFPFLLVLVYLGSMGFRPHLMWALLGGGALVAGVGWVDDRWNIRARWRLLAYAIAAVWALWWIGGMADLRVGVTTLSLGFGGTILAFVTIVWMSNLMNFMDGIDGLVGAETMLIGSVLGVMLFLSGQVFLAFILWLLAAATAGFLVWNWHPAKMFMGDTGSVLLGFTFGVLAIASERVGAVPALAWWIMFGLFFADATWTTLRRILHGHAFYEGHRAFSFHRAAVRYQRHDRVTIGVLLWSVPFVVLAWTVWRYPLFLLPALGASLLGSAVLWWWYQEPMVSRRAVVGAPDSRSARH
ncbi:MAG: glycosyltransferase family 4 protein [bacterium]|nr:glycosyltransferase family 4 protein [bacterium]